MHNRIQSTHFKLFISLLLLSACQTVPEQTARKTPRLNRAIYHWKTQYNPSGWERELLDSLYIRTQYVRFFDVDWDAQRREAVPKAIVQFAQRPGVKVIPVVFITNQTLLNIRPADLPQLAAQMSRTIRRIGKQQQITVYEVQIDCDWSNRSRQNYFQLLRLLQTELRVPLSATIRLHQVKFADQTGVPPVSRGMLMLYNMGDWKRPDTKNSIYDEDIAGRYLAYVSAYPLPLDVVLPTFGWTVVYRNNRFLFFVNNLSRQTLAESRFLQPQADSTRFVARQDTLAFGVRIRRGDLFRAEAVSAKDLFELKKQLINRLTNPSFTFALYHLDSTALAPYSRAVLQTLYAHPRP